MKVRTFMRRLYLIILSMCMLFLSGCATLNTEITIDSDGSGTWKTDVTSQVGPLGTQDITKPLENQNIKGYKLSAQTPDGKIKTIDTSESITSPVWKIEAPFKNEAELTSLRNVLSSTTSTPALQKTADGSYIVDLGKIKNFPGQTTIKVSGNIMPDSSSKGTIKDNTITFKNGDSIYFTFEPGHGWIFYVSIVLGIAVVGGISYILYLRKKYYGDAR